jgi:hypothetical protein
MKQLMLTTVVAALVLVSLPSMALAGPPLICHPFQTTGSELLPWGAGTNWNNPDPRYDVRRLRADLLGLLTPETPVLARMENMRRAAIYAAQDKAAADELLQAVIARASAPATSTAAALFDAGYLIESYKQAVHLHRRPAPTQDGYAMVVRAISATGSAEMEFAASLMTQGAPAEAHLRRARASAGSETLLAKNIENLWR